jgi:hypothetical protein
MTSKFGSASQLTSIIDKHIWDVPIPQIISARKLVVASSLMGLWNVAFTKISVLLLYMRIFPPSKLRIAIIVLITITVAWQVQMSITNFLFCIPLKAYWEIFYEGPQTCLAEVPYFVAFSVIDLILDIAIYLLPMPTLWNLKMATSQKIALIGIFGTGILYVHHL